MRHSIGSIHKVLRSPKRGSKATRRLIHDFAEEMGMVYFGYVSQLSDEHRLVRGLTVSTKHRDDHYCIGTYQGYDVVFVERTDTILTNHTHTWHIMEFDLHTTHDLPHLFIGSSQHGLGFHSLIKAKYPNMIPLQLGLTGRYPKSFTEHFSIFTAPTHNVTAELIIAPDIAATMANHCKGLVIEITSDSLYVYSEKTRLTRQFLDAMLINGVWIAKQVDEKSQL